MISPAGAIIMIPYGDAERGDSVCDRVMYAKIMELPFADGFILVRSE